jgi:hypothetical protein
MDSVRANLGRVWLIVVMSVQLASWRYFFFYKGATYFSTTISRWEGRLDCITCGGIWARIKLQPVELHIKPGCAKHARLGMCGWLTTEPGRCRTSGVSYNRAVYQSGNTDTVVHWERELVPWMNPSNFCRTV